MTIPLTPMLDGPAPIDRDWYPHVSASNCEAVAADLRQNCATAAAGAADFLAHIAQELRALPDVVAVSIDAPDPAAEPNLLPLFTRALGAVLTADQLATVREWLGTAPVLAAPSTPAEAPEPDPLQLAAQAVADAWTRGEITAKMGAVDYLQQLLAVLPASS